MHKIVISLLVLLTVQSGTVLAEPNGVRCRIQIDQKGDEIWVPLQTDTLELVQGIPASGFAVCFSSELELLAVDTSAASVLVHLVTLGPPTYTYSRNFNVEYGLPAVIEGILGKGGCEYRFSLSPLEAISADTTGCGFDHRAEDGFTFEPSANMDIFYLPRSLGDFYYATAKGVMEAGYREFHALCRFTLPGKYNLYLSPCLHPSVIWDRQFGMAIDPTRAGAFALFTIAANALDPFVLNQTALLRNWGYSPQVLSVGMAGYFSAPEASLKKIRTNSNLATLESLLTPGAFDRLDPFVADRCATGMVKFLVERDGIDRFRRCYQQAHDLNLTETVSTLYETPLSELEAEWQQWVDSATPAPVEVARQIDMAEAMFRYDAMHEYAQYLVDQANTPMDSLRFLTLLKRACFLQGDYYQALDYQEILVHLDSTSAANRTILGSYQLMAGYNDLALENLYAAVAMDSTDHVATFNLIVASLATGDTTKAVPLLKKMVSLAAGQGPSAECRIMLADLLRRSDKKTDRDRAGQLLQEAKALLQAALRLQPSASSLHMWTGLALMGEHLLPDARDHLEGALFLEARPFYLGMTNLSLGKVADLLNDRDAALYYYREVLSGNSAAYHQREAQTYIEQPYRR